MKPTASAHGGCSLPHFILIYIWAAVHKHSLGQALRLPFTQIVQLHLHLVWMGNTTHIVYSIQHEMGFCVLCEHKKANRIYSSILVLNINQEANDTLNSGNDVTSILLT